MIALASSRILKLGARLWKVGRLLCSQRPQSRFSGFTKRHTAQRLGHPYGYDTDL
jgi:hypothetical protein